MAVNVSDLEEVGPASDYEDLGPAKAVDTNPEHWATVRGERKKTLLDWINPFAARPEDVLAAGKTAAKSGEGFGGSIQEAEGIKPSPADEWLSSKVVDPTVGRINQLGTYLPAFIPYASQIGEGLSAADKFLGPKIAAMVYKNPEAILNPEDVADVGSNMGMHVKAALFGHPATLAAAAAPLISKGLKGGTAEAGAAEEAGPGVPKSVRLLRTVAQPTPGTKLSQNWETSGSNATKLLSDNWENTADAKTNYETARDTTIDQLAQERQAMLDKGEAQGATISGKSIKQAVSSVGDDPYYDRIDPEGADFFKNMADGIPDGDIPVKEAQGIYSTIERMLRNARKKAGDAEAALENNDKFQALDAIRKNIGSQLNGVLGDTPNQYFDNAKNFSDTYRVTDRIDRAIESSENKPENVFTWRNAINPFEWKGLLIKWGFGRTPLRDLNQALSMAAKKGVPVPQQNAPAPQTGQPATPAISAGFMSQLEKEANAPAPPRVAEPWTPQIQPPAKPAPYAPPSWVSDLPKATQPAASMADDIATVEKVFKSKSKNAVENFIADKDNNSAWAINLARRLQQDPANLSNNLEAIKNEVGGKAAQEHMKFQSNLMASSGIGFDPDFVDFMEDKRFGGPSGQVRAIAKQAIQGKITKAQAAQEIKQLLNDFKAGKNQ